MLDPMGTGDSWKRVNSVTPYPSENDLIGDYNTLLDQVGKIYKGANASYLIVSLTLASTGNHLSVFLLPLNYINSLNWMTAGEIG